MGTPDGPPRLFSMASRARQRRQRSIHKVTIGRGNQTSTATHLALGGPLLYPLVDDPLDVDLMVKGNTWVRTIDLATGWPDIRTQMLSLRNSRRSYAVKIPNSSTEVTDGQLDGARPCTAI